MKRFFIKRYLIFNMYFNMLVMVFKFVKFTILKEKSKAANEFNWLKFFWNCKPDSVMYKGETYKL